MASQNFVTRPGSQFVQSGTGAVERTVEEKLQDVVSVKDFGAVGDGVTDDTAAIQAANAASLALLFPAEHTFNILNWEPLTGTVISAYGATINRHSNGEFGATGSSGALVVTNDNISVYGGTWGEASGLSAPAWSCSILINGGDSFFVSEATFVDTWGGVSGHELQNGSLVSNDFVITNCLFDGCSHNTYLADIKGLIFSGNVSKNSARDGLKTYRNCVNLVITGNQLHTNGDPLATGQSRDGMDLFVAGDTCIVTDNVIHSNQARGIDIKISTAYAAETAQCRRFIIANNIVYGNLDIGMSIDGNNATAAGIIDHVVVEGNLIYSNSSYGVLLSNVQYGSVFGNTIYSNSDTGMRVDSSGGANVTKGVSIVGNSIYDNDNVGLLLLSSTGCLITGNTLTGVGTQTAGINIATTCTNIVCASNNSTGHSSYNYYSGGIASDLIRGKTIEGYFDNATGGQLTITMPPGCITSATFNTNLAVTSFDVVCSQRNASTGAAKVTFVNQTGVTAAAYVSVPLTVTATSTARVTSGGEAVLISLNNITSSFTKGILVLNYID